MVLVKSKYISWTTALFAVMMLALELLTIIVVILPVTLFTVLLFYIAKITNTLHRDESKRPNRAH